MDKKAIVIVLTTAVGVALGTVFVGPWLQRLKAKAAG